MRSLAAMAALVALCAGPAAADPASATSVLGAAVRHDRPTAIQEAAPAVNDRPLFTGLLLIVAVGVAKIVFRRRLSRRHAVTLDLVMVAVGFFLLLMMRLPLDGSRGWVGALLFFALAAVYKLLGAFEEPSE